MARYVDIDPYDNCVVVANKEDAGIKCKDIPTADVKPVVRGEWSFGKVGYFGGFKCSICGKGVNTYGCNFCPHCGADMRGDKG